MAVSHVERATDLLAHLKRDAHHRAQAELDHARSPREEGVLSRIVENHRFSGGEHAVHDAVREKVLLPSRALHPGPCCRHPSPQTVKHHQEAMLGSGSLEQGLEENLRRPGPFLLGQNATAECLELREQPVSQDLRIGRRRRGLRDPLQAAGLQALPALVQHRDARRSEAHLVSSPEETVLHLLPVHQESVLRAGPGQPIPRRLRVDEGVNLGDTLSLETQVAVLGRAQGGYPAAQTCFSLPRPVADLQEHGGRILDLPRPIQRARGHATCCPIARARHCVVLPRDSVRRRADSRPVPRRGSRPVILLHNSQ
jgi:hypothetical protein